jgi:hypothetical protein
VFLRSWGSSFKNGDRNVRFMEITKQQLPCHLGYLEIVDPA